MNITDVESPGEYPKNLLLGIFDHQRELMKKYHGIEHGNGLLQTQDVPVDIDCRFGQARLKDFAWRVTEELAEATGTSQIGDPHYKEELIDALHFLVELCILADNIPSTDMDLDSLIVQYGVSEYTIIEQLGLAMNCLKNKPWKQTHMLTDVARFKLHLGKAFQALVSLLHFNGLNSYDIYDLYFKKNRVNHFRQDSKY